MTKTDKTTRAGEDGAEAAAPQADLTGLARRYLELWQDQWNVVAADPELGEAMGRLAGLFQQQMAAMAPLMQGAFWPFAPPTTAQGAAEHGHADADTRPPETAAPAEPAAPGAAAPAAALGALAERIDQLTRRFDALEARLDALGTGDRPSDPPAKSTRRGGAKSGSRPSRRRNDDPPGPGGDDGAGGPRPGGGGRGSRPAPAGRGHRRALDGDR